MSALKFIEPGRTEIEVANFLDFKMRDLEASGISLKPLLPQAREVACLMALRPVK